MLSLFTRRKYFYAVISHGEECMFCSLPLAFPSHSFCFRFFACLFYSTLFSHSMCVCAVVCVCACRVQCTVHTRRPLEHKKYYRYLPEDNIFLLLFRTVQNVCSLLLAFPSHSFCFRFFLSFFYCILFS